MTSTDTVQTRTQTSEQAAPACGSPRPPPRRPPPPPPSHRDLRDRLLRCNG